MTIHLPASEGRSHLRLTGADFDANLPEPLLSDASRRARVELRQRMLAWARRVVERLAAMGVALEVAASDERATVRNGRRVDAQRLLFWREARPRAELDMRFGRGRARGPLRDGADACLAITVDGVNVEVALEVPPDAGADVRNLRARLADAARALELTAALEALPEQFSIGLAGSPRTEQAQRASSARLTELLDLGAAQSDPLWIGWSVPRDVAVTHSALLDEHLEDAMVALGVVYRVIAWAPDNDLVAPESTPRSSDRREPGRSRRRGPSDEESTVDSERARRREETDRAHRRAAKKARDTAPAAPDKPSPRPGKRPILRATIRSALRPASRARPLAVRAPVEGADVDGPIFERGVRVRVLAGPFVGKEGIVQELDGKGGARVMLGLLATRVAVKDLAASPEGRERPALSTSHRKIPLRGA